MGHFLRLIILTFVALAIQISPAFAAGETYDVGVSGTVTPSTTAQMLSPGDTVTLDLSFTNYSTQTIWVYVYNYLFVHKSLTLTELSSNDFSNANFMGPYYDPQAIQGLHPKLQDTRAYVIYHESYPPQTSPQESQVFHLTFSVTQTIQSGTRLYTHVPSVYNVGINSSYEFRAETEFVDANGQDDLTKISPVIGIISYGYDPDASQSNNVWNYTYSPATQQQGNASGDGSSATSGSSGSQTTTKGNTSGSSNSPSQSGVGSKGTNTGGVDTDPAVEENFSDEVEIAQGKELALPKRTSVSSRNQKNVTWTDSLYKLFPAIGIMAACAVALAFPIRRHYLANIHDQRQYRQALKLHYKRKS